MKSSARGISFRRHRGETVCYANVWFVCVPVFLTLMRFDAASERFDPYVQWLIQFFFTDAYAVPSSVVFSRI